MNRRLPTVQELRIQTAPEGCGVCFRRPSIGLYRVEGRAVWLCRPCVVQLAGLGLAEAVGI